MTMTGYAMTEREWVAPFTVDVRRTLSVQGRGRGDPTFTTDDAGAIWRTSLTPDGPATIRVLPGRTSQAESPKTPCERLKRRRTRPRACGRRPGGLAHSGCSTRSPARSAVATTFRGSPLSSPMPTPSSGTRHGGTPGCGSAAPGGSWRRSFPRSSSRRSSYSKPTAPGGSCWRSTARRPRGPRRAACASSRRQPPGGAFRRGTGTGPGWKASAPRRSSGPRAWPTAWSGCLR